MGQINLRPMQDDSPVFPTQVDRIDADRATALMRTLGRDDIFDDGDALPPFFHQLYFWDAQSPDALGRDGHPAVGGPIADMGLPRRMWAGGRLEFLAPLRANIEATKTSCVQSTSHKEGRSGALGFVTLRHDISQENQLCVREYQDLVYRSDPTPDLPKTAPPRARTDEAARRTVTFDSILLFRYSALTFNGHRIHYDLDYARDVEGYGGLVVHGPLLAQLLMLMAQEHLGALAEFSYRATSALTHQEQATLCWADDGSMWVRAPDGRLCMQATAR